MSQPSSDARAVVRALDALTTQVRRLADGAATPVVAPSGYHPTGVRTEPTTAPDTPSPLAADRADDDATTDIACPLCPAPAPFATHQQATDHFRSQHPEYGLVDGPWPMLIPPPITPWKEPAPAAADDATTPVRAIAHQVPAEAYATWTEQASFGSEDAQRTARRRSLRVLLNGVNNGTRLTADEAQLLARHVAAEICDANDAAKERTRAEQLQDLLRVAHETSNRSEAERGRAVQRAEEVERERDQQAAVLAEALRHFVHKGHPGEPCLSSGWVSVKTVDRWRSVIHHDVERPWWVQVDETRAELEQAQAAIARVRAYLASQTDAFPKGYVVAVAAADVLAALDGTEQPTTKEN